MKYSFATVALLALVPEAHRTVPPSTCVWYDSRVWARAPSRADDWSEFPWPLLCLRFGCIARRPSPPAGTSDSVMAQGTPRRRSTHPRTASRKPAPRPTARRPSGSVQGTSRQKPRPTPSKAGTARRQAGPAKRRTIAARARRPRQETAHPRRSAGHGSTDRERDERSHDHATHQGYEGYDAYGDGGYDSDAYDAYADPRGRDSLRLGEHPVLLLTIVLYAVVWVLALVRFWQLTPAAGSCAGRSRTCMG